MAESQIIYNYDAGNAESLRLSLSEERFAPYLIKAGHNESYAFNLYLYNARLSKAFLFPLHMLEVSLRNRIDSIFKEDFGENWPNEFEFRTKLNAESQNNLDTAINRASTGKTEDIVATLSFDFWSNLFRSEYDRCFWQTQMKTLLPNTSKTRSSFQNVVKKINKFRNRIAHHEPIHHLDISKIHKEILDMVDWICQDTKDWVKHYSTVNAVIRSSPSPSNESKPHFSERCDNNFQIVSEVTTLDKFSGKNFTLVQKADEVICVLEEKHLYRFLKAQVDKDDKSLMVDLSEYTFSDIFKLNIIERNYECCGHTESLSKARDILKKPHIEYILVRDPTSIIGILAKAHRRY